MNMKQNKKSMVQELLDYQDKQFIAESKFYPEVETIQNADGTYTRQRVGPAKCKYVRNWDGTFALRNTTGTTNK